MCVCGVGGIVRWRWSFSFLSALRSAQKEKDGNKNVYIQSKALIGGPEVWLFIGSDPEIGLFIGFG